MSVPVDANVDDEDAISFDSLRLLSCVPSLSSSKPALLSFPLDDDNCWICCVCIILAWLIVNVPFNKPSIDFKPTE